MRKQRHIARSRFKSQHADGFVEHPHACRENRRSK
eukprot:COSAG04_NODE_6055_length_1420_cov_1.153555_2_plen_34_part_01